VLLPNELGHAVIVFTAQAVLIVTCGRAIPSRAGLHLCAGHPVYQVRITSWVMTGGKLNVSVAAVRIVGGPRFVQVDTAHATSRCGAAFAVRLGAINEAIHRMKSISN
jgi:hypothetical protein